VSAAVLLAASLALAADGGVPGFVRANISEVDPTLGCQYWQDTQINWVQASTGNTGDSPTPGDTELTAVAAAFGSWQAQAAACGNFTLLEQTRTPNRITGYDQQTPGNNQNLVLFRPKLCSMVAPNGDACFSQGTCGNKYDCFQYASGNIAITTTTFSTRTGRIFDADIEMNASKVLTAVDAPPCPPNLLSQSCVAFDIQNTLTHEIGHFMGLAHDPSTESTMYFSASPGELKKRALDPGTQQFVCDVYPRGLPSQPCVVRAVTNNDPMPASACSAMPGAAMAVAALVVLLILPVLRPVPASRRGRRRGGPA
jgi:hypothetical protein